MQPRRTEGRAAARRDNPPCAIRGRAPAILLLALVSIALVECRGAPPDRPAAPRPSAAPLPAAYETVLIAGIPHVRQKPDLCGEACAEMFLRKLGFDLDQADVFERTGLDPALGRGAHTAELKVALESLGFDVGPVWHTASSARLAADLEGLWAGLHADLRRSVPSIVCTHWDESPAASEHFRLVLGYDARTDEVVYHDPAVDRGAYLRMPRSRFLRLWPLAYSKDASTVVRIRLEPGRVSAPRPRTGTRSADYALHVMQLRERYAARGFTVTVEPPFVVIGDEAADTVQRRARGIVRWTVERLKADFFSRDPDGIVDIWLFRDHQSYESNARQILGEAPTTPYGYYSSSKRALVMNIATGGGTLVHEIVHPFMAANFPACPPWLNEGLGSLYEQSADRDGHIVGLTNWRLEGLQQAIRAGSVPAFERLFAMGEREFYDLDRGTNYAQARYLLYYLQENGLLVRFYREMHAARAVDPTGVETMRRVLGERDLRAFQVRWERFVLGLRFPEPSGR
jgi:hypothetical protein